MGQTVILYTLLYTHSHPLTLTLILPLVPLPSSALSPLLSTTATIAPSLHLLGREHMLRRLCHWVGEHVRRVGPTLSCMALGSFGSWGRSRLGGGGCIATACRWGGGRSGDCRLGDGGCSATACRGGGRRRRRGGLRLSAYSLSSRSCLILPPCTLRCKGLPPTAPVVRQGMQRRLCLALFLNRPLMQTHHLHHLIPLSESSGREGEWQQGSAILFLSLTVVEQGDPLRHRRRHRRPHGEAREKTPPLRPLLLRPHPSLALRPQQFPHPRLLLLVRDAFHWQRMRAIRPLHRGVEVLLLLLLIIIHLLHLHTHLGVCRLGLSPHLLLQLIPRRGSPADPAFPNDDDRAGLAPGVAVSGLPCYLPNRLTGDHRLRAITVPLPVPTPRLLCRPAVQELARARRSTLRTKESHPVADTVRFESFRVVAHRSPHRMAGEE